MSDFETTTVLETAPEEPALSAGAAGAGTAAEASQQPLIVIRPPPRWVSLDLAEVSRYSDLLLLLIWRDIAARYRQSVVGYGWAIIKPVISTVIFTIVFGRVAGISTDGSPYPLFSFTALLPWMYFSNALTTTSSSVVGNGALLTKVYFPRLILPLTSVVGGLTELLIQFVILVGVMVYYGVSPHVGLLALPGFLVMAGMSALAAGLWLTALNVRYRDIGHAVPFFAQAWMWVSPIVYSSQQVSEKWRPLYSLNPMVGIIEGFRWSVYGSTYHTPVPDSTMMSISFAAVLAMLVSGLYYFRKTESTFADVI